MWDFRQNVGDKHFGPNYHYIQNRYPWLFGGYVTKNFHKWKITKGETTVDEKRRANFLDFMILQKCGTK